MSEDKINIVPGCNLTTSLKTLKHFEPVKWVVILCAVVITSISHSYVLILLRIISFGPKSVSYKFGGLDYNTLYSVMNFHQCSMVTCTKEL